MSKSDVWMPIFIGDYMADTMHLTAAQHGAYLLMLMHQWRTGPLPTDDAQLAAIARCDLPFWRKNVAPIVRRFFDETPAGLSQKRLAAEKAEAEANTVKRSAAGRAGAAGRWQADGETPGQGNATADATGHANDMAAAMAIASKSHSQTDTPSPSPIKAVAGGSKSPRANGPAARAQNTPRLSDPPDKWLHLCGEREVDDGMVTRPVVGGQFLDLVARRVCEAAGINDANWRGDWKPVIDWLEAGHDADHIVAVITHMAARSSYQPPKSLRYFTAAVNDGRTQ